MATNPVIVDLYSAVEYWIKSWNKGGFEDYLDNTPLGRVLDWGAMPYNAPFGINWSDPDDDEHDEDVEVEEKHYETQEELLRALSKSVVEGILLNPDNMIILADLGENGEPDNATLIFPDKTGNMYYGIKFRSLLNYDKGSKSVGQTRSFYRNMRVAEMESSYPKKNYRKEYEQWQGWLDNSGDFYGNLSDVFRDSLAFRFETDEEEMLNLEDNSLDDFSKVWIVVAKTDVLPLLLNWTRESAQQLWNLLRR